MIYQKARRDLDWRYCVLRVAARNALLSQLCTSERFPTAVSAIASVPHFQQVGRTYASCCEREGVCAPIEDEEDVG